MRHFFRSLFGISPSTSPTLIGPAVPGYYPPPSPLESLLVSLIITIQEQPERRTMPSTLLTALSSSCIPRQVFSSPPLPSFSKMAGSSSYVCLFFPHPFLTSMRSFSAPLLKKAVCPGGREPGLLVEAAVESLLPDPRTARSPPSTPKREVCSKRAGHLLSWKDASVFTEEHFLQHQGPLGVRHQSRS